MRVDPYLYFNGRCAEAVEFYRRALNAEVLMLTRFGDNPQLPAAAGTEDLVMHAALRFGPTTVFASDGQRRGDTNFNGFSLSMTVSEDREAERLYKAILEGGQTRMPMTSTPFASRMGMAVDRFGVLWTVVAQKESKNIT